MFYRPNAYLRLCIFINIHCLVESSKRIIKNSSNKIPGQIVLKIFGGKSKSNEQNRDLFIIYIQKRYGHKQTISKRSCANCQTIVFKC